MTLIPDRDIPADDPALLLARVPLHPTTLIATITAWRRRSCAPDNLDTTGASSGTLVPRRDPGVRESGVVASPMPLEGRVALVTGASRRSAIGVAVARRMVTDAATVLLHSWSPHDAEQPWGADPGGAQAVIDELRAQGGQITHVSADLADPTAPALLVAAARQAFGHLDILVANHARSSAQTLEQLTAEEIDLTYAVNTRATLLLVQALADQHDGRPGGRVVLFTSGQYHTAMPGQLPYIAAKGALHQLTPSLAAHLMPRGIAVNCIDPVPNDTGYAQTGKWTHVATQNPG